MTPDILSVLIAIAAILVGGGIMLTSRIQYLRERSLHRSRTYPVIGSWLPHGTPLRGIYNEK